jgi:hypothetical protein
VCVCVCVFLEAPKLAAAVGMLVCEPTAACRGPRRGLTKARGFEDTGFGSDTPEPFLSASGCAEAALFVLVRSPGGLAESPSDLRFGCLPPKFGLFIFTIPVFVSCKDHN